jgi:putative FmdB family regulatory protein
MPVFEYLCDSCGRVTSVLVLEPRGEPEVRCRFCESTDVERVVSGFAVHQTESQRMADFDTGAPADDSLNQDSRNVGLWAKKRAKELGAELGPEFDDAVEKARTGKTLDDL